MKPVLLVDCDGVLSDFTHATLKVLERDFGIRKKFEDVKAMDIFDGDKELEREFKARIAGSGFCYGLEPLPGAVEFVDAAQDAYDVVVLTAPYDVKGWCDERSAWVRDVLGLPRSSVIFAHCKELVDGAAFLDDSASNVAKWAEAHPDALAALNDQPWNQDGDGVVRVFSFEDFADELAAWRLPRIKL